MRKALVIGINKYNFGNLTGCINDANKVTNLLARNEDGSKNFDVKKITDEYNYSINKNYLNTEIKKLFESDCEVVLLYFSGHGAIETTGGYILTPDCESIESGISMEYILKLINNSKSKNKFIILDCCNSGSLGGLSILNDNSSLLSDGTIVLTSSKENEVSLEKDGHGLFTSLLISALEGDASDLLGNITMASIYSYIDSALGMWDQRPIFKTNISKFISVRNVEPSIEIKKLRNLTKYFPDIDYKYKLDKSYEPTEKCKIEENTRIFGELQKMVSLGLVRPVGEKHMYYAAINNKSCELTNLGARYWKLIHLDRI